MSDNKNVKEHNYYKWSVESGDYKRDNEFTISNQRKLKTKKKIKTMLLMIIYFIAVSVVSYLILTQF